jgi:hypothetical protein
VTAPVRPASPLARARTALRLLRLRLELPLLFRRVSLPELLARVEAGGGRPAAIDELQASVERLFRPLRFWRTTCLWRALGGYSALRAAGADVRFLIGVRLDRGELVAHAWLERDGRPSLGAPSPAEGYTVAFAWPAGEGTLRPEVRTVPGIAPSKDAVLTELPDGTGVLLHLDTKFYFTLNRTGVLAWKLLGDAGARDAAELGARLAREFPDADPAAVRADVERLVEELTRERLVTRVG